MKDAIASLFFSVLIVVFFAVALYHRDAPCLQVPSPPARTAAPDPTKPEAMPTPRRRSVATTVEPGEDLAAVAQRVYGSKASEILDRLRQANRDQLINPDSAVTPGTLLRTP